MMKILKNEKLARWVIGIVVVGLVMAYVPLLFVPQPAQAPEPTPQPAPDQYLPQQPIELPAVTPPEIVTSTVGVSVTSTATGTTQ
ncbi:MAG: hypothetical protein Q7S84_04005 [bacterium]|nr:hypothetical protein [bacterium]